MAGGWGVGTGRRKVLLVVLLIMALSLAAGCGRAAEQPAGRGAESGAERAVESAASGDDGGGLDIDIKGNTITVTNEEGERLDATAYEGQVPKSFPLSIPRGWRVQEFLEMESEGYLSWMGRFTFDGDPGTEAGNFRKMMEDMGFEVSEMFGGGDALAGEEGEYGNMMGVAGTIGDQFYTGMVGFLSEEGQNEVSIMFGEAPPDLMPGYGE